MMNKLINKINKLSDINKKDIEFEIRTHMKRDLYEYMFQVPIFDEKMRKENVNEVIYNKYRISEDIETGKYYRKDKTQIHREKYEDMLLVLSYDNEKEIMRNEYNRMSKMNKTSGYYLSLIHI